MIIANDIRYGLDIKLYRIQQYLDKKMPDAMIYAQLYETDKKNGKTLEWSLDEKEVFINDDKTIIGFRLLNKSPNYFLCICQLDCICTMKTDNREYSEALLYKYLANCGLINEITAVKLGIDNVFNGINTDNIKYRDIYPYHVFAYTIEVSCNYDICI